MDTRTDVSIIIPHYNTPRTLAKLLDSVPDKENIQTIVIDDHSSRMLPEYDRVKKQYAGRVLFLDNTSGVQSAGACRNIGLEHARGKWVLFADSDDFFLADMYQKIEKYFDAAYDIIYFVPTSIYLDSGQAADRHRIMESQIEAYLADPSPVTEFRVRNSSPTWSKLIRRSLLTTHRIRFSPSLHANDVVFSAVSGYYAKEICATREVIYCITRNKGSLTTRMGRESFDIRLEECIKAYAFMRDHYERSLCDQNHITGMGRLYEAMKQKYGVRYCLEIVRRFRAAGVPIFTAATLHPGYVIHMIRKRAEFLVHNEKYYIEAAESRKGRK